MKKSCISSPKTFRLFCYEHPSLTACAARCVTLFWVLLLLQGRKPWNISNALTCSLSRWIASGAGTAITISLAICCARDWENLKEFAEFHLRASQWHAENGDMGAAFHHAIAAGDFCPGGGSAEAAWQGMNGSFQSAAWLGWVKKLPDNLIRTRPVLCTQIAQAFTDTGELEASGVVPAGR